MKKTISALYFFALILMSLVVSGKETKKILFLGDSLTEGYGVSKEQSYPYHTRNFLSDKGVSIELLNGSVSGSTTASAKSRLRWFLKAKPHLVFLALGANDGLRGIKVKESKENLAAAIELAKEKGVKVVLAGMMVPPNYGPDYGKKFKSMYEELAKEKDVPVMPFLLEDVAGEKAMNQEDGIHPNIEGHKKMGKNVGEFLLPLLKEKKNAGS